MSTDPRRSPEVRDAVTAAFDDVLTVAETIDHPTARDVVRRNCDRDGRLEVPDPVSFGDVTGLLSYGETRVLDRLGAVDDEPLRDALAEARRVVAEVRGAIDAYQRERYGEHWSPAA